MKNNTLIFGIGAILALFLVGGGAAAAASFANSLSVSRIRVNQFRLSGLNLTFNLVFSVANPTNLPLVFDRITGNIFYNNNIILTSMDSFFNQITIPAGGSQDVTVRQTVSLLGLGGDIVGLIQNGFSLPNMRMQGNVFAPGGLSIPFSRNILNVG